MTSAPTVKCKVRAIKSRGYLQQMKRDDFIPGVIYGKGYDSVPVFFEGRELNRLFQKEGYRGLFTLQVEGQPRPTMALVRELQKHPVSGKLIHLDFLAVSMDEKIQSSVSLIITGEEELIRNGGVPQMGAREVEVICLARDLPESFTVDISSMAIGEKISLGDIKLPEGVELAGDPETLVITVLAPGRTEEEETPEGEEEEPQAQDAEE